MAAEGAAPMRFDGQVAIVTGGAGGLGRAYADELAARGACVLVNDAGVAMDGGGDGDARAERAAAEIRARGGDAVADVHDVAGEPEAVVAAALDRWGRVDMVVANAGAAAGGRIADATREDWEVTLGAHVLGAAGVVRHAWEPLRERAGRIVLVSSANGLGRATGIPYAAAKASIVGLTRSLALEGERDGIRANAILPLAWTRGTEAIADRYGDTGFATIVERHFAPAHVAAFVILLLHESTDLNGGLFSVGGGRAAAVFVGVTRGWTGADPTPEAFAEHLGEVLDRDGHAVPASGSDEMAWALERIGVEHDRGPFLSL